MMERTNHQSPATTATRSPDAASTQPAEHPRALRPHGSVGDYGCPVIAADVRALQEGDLGSREEHLYELLDRARTGTDESAVAALRTLVRDYPDFHRSLYSRALNQAALFGDGSLAEPLLAALADRRYNCQAWAAMGCTALGIRAAVPGLLALLERDDWMARDQAVIGLGELGDESVVPALAPLLRDSGEAMRQRAAEALARIGGGAALAALWEQFENRGYARIGYIASALATFTPEVVPRLIEAAGSEDPNTRYWAAVALGSTGTARSYPHSNGCSTTTAAPSSTVG